MIQSKLKKTMKTSHIFGFTVLLMMIVAVALILSALNNPVASAQQMNASIQAQVTSTPLEGDQTVAGSTDGIVVMGLIIAVIIFTPLIFRRKRK
jgi:hypothetical protein